MESEESFDSPAGVKFNIEDFAGFAKDHLKIGDRYYAPDRSFVSDFRIFKQELSEGVPEAEALAREFFVFLVKKRLT